MIWIVLMSTETETLLRIILERNYSDRKDVQAMHVRQTNLGINSCHAGGPMARLISGFIVRSPVTPTRQRTGENREGRLENEFHGNRSFRAIPHVVVLVKCLPDDREPLILGRLLSVKIIGVINLAIR